MDMVLSQELKVSIEDASGKTPGGEVKDNEDRPAMFAPRLSSFRGLHEFQQRGCFAKWLRQERPHLIGDTPVEPEPRPGVVTVVFFTTDSVADNSVKPKLNSLVNHQAEQSGAQVLSSHISADCKRTKNEFKATLLALNADFRFGERPAAVNLNVPLVVQFHDDVASWRRTAEARIVFGKQPTTKQPGGERMSFVVDVNSKLPVKVIGPALHGRRGLRG